MAKGWKEANSLEKTLMLGEIGGKRRRGQQRMRWLDGITDSKDKFEQTPGDSGGYRSLAGCSPLGCKESDTTEWLNWTDLSLSVCLSIYISILGFSCDSASRVHLKCRRDGFDPWVGKIPWRRARQPTPVFLLENHVDRGTWWATVHGLATAGHDLGTKSPQSIFLSFFPPSFLSGFFFLTICSLPWSYDVSYSLSFKFFKLHLSQLSL